MSRSHKIFVKAISSTYDEVALTKGNNGKLTPPHNVPAIVKKTYPINNCELVSKFAARWQLFQKYFLAPTTNNQMKQDSNNNGHEKTRFTLKRRPQHTRKTKSNIIKTPQRIKRKRNTDTPSLMQCMTNQRCLH
jgi:hypothetical protein